MLNLEEEEKYKRIYQSIRHTPARELRARSVPAWKVAAQLGHQRPGLSTTEIYAPYDPAYLAKAVVAIEVFYHDVIGT